MFSAITQSQSEVILKSEFLTYLSMESPPEYTGSPMASSTGKSIAIIGVGNRTLSKAIPALTQLIPDSISINALVEPNPSDRAKTVLPECTLYPSVKTLLSDSTKKIDFAYVSVPHSCYAEILCHLLRAGVHVLKEKPLAINSVQGAMFAQLAKEGSAYLGVAAQRRFSERYAVLRKWLPKVGTVRAVHALEKIVVPKLDDGWRASNGMSGGGVVLDMGYHMLDQLIGLFGPEFTDVTSTLLKTRVGDYDVEDTAHIQITFRDGIEVNLILSRTGARSEEILEIVGEKGLLKLDGPTVSHFDTHGILIETCLPSDAGILTRMFRSFTTKQEKDWDIERDLAVMTLIDSIYTNARRTGVQPSPGFPRPSEVSYLRKWSWPIISSEVERAVQSQLHTALSIYDNSGIFCTFESKFKNLHQAPNSYALLHNSGTNSLHALYYSAGLSHGDEVLVPVYTFHATVSPLMQLGVTPIFVDSDPLTGNIDVTKIQKLIGPKTKAIVVTHMWGIPCAMEEIVQICKSANILLFEDCSHSHGATINGKSVGIFGDGAAWSLQGDKVVTGGEGGISLTRHADMHYKQLIHGHYNKRCKVEIPEGHPLKEFSLTGTGLKNRAHPLAIAIALTQLQALPQILYWKTNNAARMINMLRPIPFLIAPELQHGCTAAWYALVFRFDQTLAPRGISREQFVAELHRRGLTDVDIPNSTRPLNQEPLYLRPWAVLPHMYTKEEYAPEWLGREFPGAQQFHKSAIKLPVWATAEDIEVVEAYGKGILQVAYDFLSGTLDA